MEACVRTLTLRMGWDGIWLPPDALGHMKGKRNRNMLNLPAAPSAVVIRSEEKIRIAVLQHGMNLTSRAGGKSPVPRGSTTGFDYAAVAPRCAANANFCHFTSKPCCCPTHEICTRFSTSLSLCTLSRRKQPAHRQSPPASDHLQAHRSTQLRNVLVSSTLSTPTADLGENHQGE